MLVVTGRRKHTKSQNETKRTISETSNRANTYWKICHKLQGLHSLENTERMQAQNTHSVLSTASLFSLLSLCLTFSTQKKSFHGSHGHRAQSTAPFRQLGFSGYLLRWRTAAKPSLSPSKRKTKIYLPSTPPLNPPPPSHRSGDDERNGAKDAPNAPRRRRSVCLTRRLSGFIAGVI